MCLIDWVVGLVGLVGVIGVVVVRVIKAVGAVVVLGCCDFDLLGRWVVCLVGPLSVSLIVGSLFLCAFCWVNLSACSAKYGRANNMKQLQRG